jgi:hypothetical protein
MKIYKTHHELLADAQRTEDQGEGGVLFLKETKAAYSKMLSAQEVCCRSKRILLRGED